MTTISDAMKHNYHQNIKKAAIGLSIFVYAAGLIYAGVRSFTLFASTIDPNLLLLALLGILALEFTAIGLPLAIHFWTQPGPQRWIAYVFYAVDLIFIAGNVLHAGNLCLYDNTYYIFVNRQLQFA